MIMEEQFLFDFFESTCLKVDVYFITALIVVCKIHCFRFKNNRDITNDILCFSAWHSRLIAVFYCLRPEGHLLLSSLTGA